MQCSNSFHFLASCVTLLLPATVWASGQLESSSTSSLSQTSGSEYRQNTVGLYPIWENTGYVERHGEIYMGTSSAHLGVQDVAQIGANPVYFAYRTPNAYAKFQVLNTAHWHLAAQVGIYHLMEEASRAYLSPMYTSRLDNPDFSVNIVPVSLAATTDISNWLQIHQSVTALTMFSSGPLATATYIGYMASAELSARRHHSILLHAGEVGFWNHDFSVLGMSYRYQGSLTELRIGYFYRMRPDSMQSSPMISLGLLL